MVKIILGAAQLKSRYGINEDYTSTKEFIKILRICKKNNIKKIDTALDYNKLGSQLTKFYLKNFNIISKIKFKQKKNLLIEWDAFKVIDLSRTEVTFALNGGS